MDRDGLRLGNVYPEPVELTLYLTGRNMGWDGSLDVALSRAWPIDVMCSCRKEVSGKRMISQAPNHIRCPPQEQGL